MLGKVAAPASRTIRCFGNTHKKTVEEEEDGAEAMFEEKIG